MTPPHACPEFASTDADRSPSEKKEPDTAAQRPEGNRVGNTQFWARQQEQRGTSDFPGERTRGRVRVAVIVACAAVLAAVLGVVIPSDALLGVAFATNAILLLIAAMTILRRVIRAIAVDFRTILGAISVFTRLGLCAASPTWRSGRLQSGEVFAGVAHPKSSDFLFFSYTTLTTTGYGNLVPSGVIGQILAVFEMLIGQIFLVTLVAGLVSLWRPGSKLPPDEPSG